MFSRSTIIAGLLVVEIAIFTEIVAVIRGAQAGPWPMGQAEMMSGDRLAEGGQHKTFKAGSHPALSVDIGYADLTIATADVSQIDVAVSKSNDFSFFVPNAPITALQDGDTIRIATRARHKWSGGDDRMVTVLVPPGTTVTVPNAGDIKASGLRGEASFSSVGNGTVTIEDYDGPALTVTSADGRISLRQVTAGSLHATSRNDSVRAPGVRVRNGDVESDDSVALGFAAGADTLVSAKTDDGKIRVSGLSVAPSFVTGNDGRDSDSDSASQTVRVGAGTGRLDVHSNDGNIDLTQES